MKKVLFMHTGSGNHGCEALVRTTAALLGGPKDVVLWSLLKDEEYHYGTVMAVEKVVRNEELERCSLAHVEAVIRRRLLRQKDGRMNVFLRKLFKKSIAISIGGDNYCYPWSAKQAVELDEKLRRRGIKTVLWGCSIDEEALTDEVRRDLAAFDLITAREPLTYRLLKPINPNTKLVADPAFLLETVKRPLPEGFLEGNTVGINVSPLIMEYADGGLILDNYRRLIRYIIEKTDMNICLIPHVVWEFNNDRKPIELLYKEFQSTGRVCQVGDHNCMELKGFIARCRFFIGARTHATIAAYSSLVPTLVVGYSIKSRGIAQDLFGTEDNYVLSVQKMTNPDQLTAAFRWLVDREEEIRIRLRNVIPTYQDRARAAADYLHQIEKGK